MKIDQMDQTVYMDQIKEIPVFMFQKVFAKCIYFKSFFFNEASKFGNK